MSETAIAVENGAASADVLCIHNPEYVCPVRCQRRDTDYCAVQRSTAPGKEDE